MITIESKNNRLYPRLMCDWCGTKIKDATKANAEYDGNEHKNAVYTLHKRCSFLRKVKEGPLTYWEPLHSFLFKMLHNTRYTKPNAELIND